MNRVSSQVAVSRLPNIPLFVSRKKANEANLADYLIVVLTAVIAFWAGMTWWEMHDSSTQTNKIITADERMATAMENSLKQSGKSLDATVDQFHLDQRAWVGVVEAAPGSYEVGGRKVYIKAGEKPKFAFLVANSGKTPALRLTTKITSHAYRSTEPFIAHYERPATVGTVGTLFPAAKMPLETLPTPGVAESFHVDSLSRGEYVFYVYGEIHYDDVFNKAHKTTFCVFITKTLDQLVSCNAYNSAD